MKSVYCELREGTALYGPKELLFDCCTKETWTEVNHKLEQVIAAVVRDECKNLVFGKVYRELSGTPNE